MSSESSDEESVTAESTTITRPVLKVKKLVWLKKKYRDALHQIDNVYYRTHKRSKDKLKCLVPGGPSTRVQPINPPKFAIKSEFRMETDQTSSSLNSSMSSEVSTGTDLE